MKRIVLGIALVCSVVGISPASAQTYTPHWSQDVVQVAESAGTAVLTLGKNGPGHVQYWTEDGDCKEPSPSPSPYTNCGPPYARAPGDYGAVSGEVIFTEAGSRQITIPIVDDSQDEGDETFTVWAIAEGFHRFAKVSIVDDDGDSDGAREPVAGTMSSTTTIRRAAPGSGPPIALAPAGAAGVDAPPTPTTSPSADLEVKIASGELDPGPGFELTSDEGPQPAPDRQDENGGSATSLALGLGAAAATGGVAMSRRRRRRWSPTRS